MESGSGSGAVPAGPESEAEQPPSTAAAEGSSSVAAAAAVASGSAAAGPLSRYESQKRRDWNTFKQYLQNHKPPLTLPRCSGAHVIEFLKYLDQFGKTKVHLTGCTYFGQPHPPATCGCPLKQAWGSLDALIGRLRAAYEENGGRSETNPFGTRGVRIYLKEVRESQAKARGIPYEKKRKRSTTTAATSVAIAGGSCGGVGSSGAPDDGPPAGTGTGS